MKITNLEVPRRVQLKKAYLLADIRSNKMGYFGRIIRHSTRQHALLEGYIEGKRSRGKREVLLYTFLTMNSIQFYGYNDVDPIFLLVVQCVEG